MTASSRQPRSSARLVSADRQTSRNSFSSAIRWFAPSPRTRRDSAIPSRSIICLARTLPTPGIDSRSADTFILPTTSSVWPSLRTCGRLVAACLSLFLISARSLRALAAFSRAAARCSGVRGGRATRGHLGFRIEKLCSRGETSEFSPPGQHKPPFGTSQFIQYYLNEHIRVLTVKLPSETPCEKNHRCHVCIVCIKHLDYHLCTVGLLRFQQSSDLHRFQRAPEVPPQPTDGGGAARARGVALARGARGCRGGAAARAGAWRWRGAAQRCRGGGCGAGVPGRGCGAGVPGRAAARGVALARGGAAVPGRGCGAGRLCCGSAGPALRADCRSSAASGPARWIGYHEKRWLRAIARPGTARARAGTAGLPSFPSPACAVTGFTPGHREIPGDRQQQAASLALCCCCTSRPSDVAAPTMSPGAHDRSGDVVAAAPGNDNTGTTMLPDLGLGTGSMRQVQPTTRRARRCQAEQGRPGGHDRGGADGGHDQDSAARTARTTRTRRPGAARTTRTRRPGRRARPGAGGTKSGGHSRGQAAPRAAGTAEGRRHQERRAQPRAGGTKSGGHSRGQAAPRAAGTAEGRRRLADLGGWAAEVGGQGGTKSGGGGAGVGGLGDGAADDQQVRAGAQGSLRGVHSGLVVGRLAS